MSKTILGRTLLLVLVIGGAGCGESPQPGTTPQPPAPPASAARSAAPAQQSDTAPAQSTMEVRPPESAAMPPPPAAATVTPSQTATAAAPAPATSTTKPATVSAKGTLLKTSELKEKPFIDARTLASLPAQSAVTILERNGGWFRVQAAAQSGWVRMLNVKVTEGAQNLSTGTDLTQAATLATGRAGSGNIVSTSGLRGLSEEELRTAQPDYTQFDKLNSYGVDKTAASSYAKSNGLAGRTVQYLPTPAK
jgi:hypothetical protein